MVSFPKLETVSKLAKAVEHKYKFLVGCKSKKHIQDFASLISVKIVVLKIVLIVLGSDTRVIFVAGGGFF